MTKMSKTKAKPLFTLTVKEVNNLQSLFDALKMFEKHDVIHLGFLYNTFIDKLLIRIKTFQDDNIN